MSDSKEFTVEGEGRKDLELAMQLAFRGSKASGYYISTAGLVFSWHPDSSRINFVKLSFQMDYKQAAEFAANWLDRVAYPVEPDHDGDNHKGWTMHRNTWGHVDGDRYAIIAIKPTWSMYGK